MLRHAVLLFAVLRYAVPHRATPFRASLRLIVCATLWSGGPLSLGLALSPALTDVSGDVDSTVSVSSSFAHSLDGMLWFGPSRNCLLLRQRLWGCCGRSSSAWRRLLDASPRWLCFAMLLDAVSHCRVFSLTCISALRCITLSCCIFSLWCLHLLPLRTGLHAAPCISTPHVSIFCPALLQFVALQ